MKIAVVGATGPTGQRVVSQALERGHKVVAYVRRPDALIARVNLTVVPGQLADTNEFADAIRGCDAVVCTLGSRSWRERKFMTHHLPLVTSAMARAGVTRLILMSALGGGIIPAHVSGVNRLVFQFLSRVVFADRTISEAALAATGLRWSAVYPGFLTNDEPSRSYATVSLDDLRTSPKGRIPRSSVADVLITLAEKPELDGQRLAIGEGSTLTKER